MGFLRPWRAWMFLFLLLAGMTLLAAWRLGLWKAARATAPVAAWEEAKVPAGTDEQKLVAANNAFALNLYGRLKETPGNLVFSPYSLSTALSMTLGGARGGTEAQMAKVLRLDLPRETLHPAAAAIVRKIAGGEKGSPQPPGDGCEIVVANSLWGQKGHPFLPEFLALLKDRYGAESREADFKAAPDPARAAINAWAEEKTKGKVKDLISPGLLTPITRLVLANAVHFKGVWEHEFDREFTSDAPFRLSAGGVVSVPLMHQLEVFRYWEGKGLQALEMPYGEGHFSMLVLLPRRPDGLPGLDALLTPGRLAAIEKGMQGKDVEVFLPRFRIEPPTSRLEQALAALGMPDAFEPGKADFSGVNGKKPPHPESLFIHFIVQKASVDVDERGTEAAAATAIGLSAAESLEPPPPPPVFRADRPFLFLVRHRETGAILFMGRVTNPKG
ncbi:MAG: serpin family protein [Planctomycetota bacterium]